MESKVLRSLLRRAAPYIKTIARNETAAPEAAGLYRDILAELGEANAPEPRGFSVVGPAPMEGGDVQRERRVTREYVANRPPERKQA